MNPDSPHITPPRWMDGLLRRFCAEEVVEHLLGDLHELYRKRRSRGLRIRADFIYLFEVLDMLRPFALRRKRSNNSNYIAMLDNYLKVAWRNLLKYKLYSVIKLGGFAIGVAAFLLISLFVKDELSYDKQYTHTDRIYRLLNVSTYPGEIGRWPAFPPLATKVIRDRFPEVELVGRLLPYSGWWDAGNNQIRPADDIQNYYEEGFAYADPEILQIMEVPMIYGTQEAALAQPNSLVLSKKKADKYFPGENPVGKTLILNEDEANPFVVGGVMEDFPSNKHLQFDFFITLTSKEFWPGEQTDWCCWNYNPYLRLRPGTDAAELEEKLMVLIHDFVLPYQRERGDVSWETYVDYYAFDLQPVSDIHLKSTDVESPFPRGDIRIVWLFASIAVFVLLLACINFINLSTAKSSNRAKEVGLRKVVGSFRSHLVQQFLTESLVVCAISVVLGLLLASLFLPFFNDLAGKSLSIPLDAWWFSLLVVLFTLVIGLIAGLYPSFYLSAFRPIEVLKGSLSRGSKSSRVRSVMVIFQFTTSIVLIVGALMVHRQMDFILNKKLGFNKDQVLMIQGVNTLGDQLKTFKQELLKLRDVEHAALGDYLPIAGTKRDGNTFWLDGRSKIDEGVPGQRWYVDEDYISTMGMKLLEGRNFSDDIASDTAAIIINQAMAQKLGLENPLGTKIMNWQTWNVIGVIEDFHYQSMKQEKIKPLTMVYGNFGSVLSVKLNTNDMVGSMERIKAKWDEFMPNQHIRYNFLDDSFAHMYDDVKRTGNVFSAFALLAIIVACLGLFGLSAFMVEQRSKEISIRKVLGASLQEIFRLLTINFTRMIIVSLVIAVPVGYLMIKQWLEDFKYQTPIEWNVFVIAGLMVMVIALATVSYESVRAALVNPTRGLRSD